MESKIIEMKNSPITTNEGVSATEQRLQILEKKILWQEHLHHDVAEDGNIYHVRELIPQMIFCGAAGAAIVLVFLAIMKKKK